MDGRDIPGFYFDREKKKYFKIQKSHNAPSPGSKYTPNNIRKEREKEKAQKDAATRSANRQKETIVRRYLRDSLMQARLDREVGLRGASCYVKNIWPDACTSNLARRPQAVVGRLEYGQLRYFDRDPVTKTLYAVHEDNKIKRRRINTSDGLPLPPEELDFSDHEYSFEPWDEIGRLTSSISSLTYLPTSGALAATTYGSDRSPVVYLSDPDRDGPYVNQQFTPKSTCTIWAAAARPTSLMVSSNSIAATETENLAVAASSSLLLFTRSPAGVWDSTTVLKTNSDILALDWLSPTVLTLGERSGKIRLYDTRSKGSSHILTHPGLVSQIRRADDPTRIVSAGLQDTLFLYDIRSARFSSTSPDEYNNQHYNQQYFAARELGTSKGKKRRKLNHAALKWSQPVLSFQHHNSEDPNLGLDVHPRLGLVAAAQDASTSSSVLKLHNLWTGKMVKEVSGDKLLNEPNKSKTRICCLKFMDDEGTGETGLWTNWLGGISRFNW